MKLLAACAAIGVVTALLSPAAMASPIVVDFANNAGLGNSTGTTATIDQNGIRMSVLSGTYLIRNSPGGDHSLDLLDVSGKALGSNRSIRPALGTEF